MKKALLTILMSMGVLTAHSQVMVATHYDAETTSTQIIRGRIKNYLADNIEYVTEKKIGKYTILILNNPDDIYNRLYKVFGKGKPEYISRTNGGYIFTIAITDREDNIKVINYVTFHVDAFTQKIEEIEILLGE
jgi:hypothetical protein